MYKLGGLWISLLISKIMIKREVCGLYGRVCEVFRKVFLQLF